MTFDKFSKEFIESLKKDGLDVETRKVLKVNEVLTEVFIKGTEEKFQAALLLEKIYDKYESGIPLNQLINDSAYILKHIDLTFNVIEEIDLENVKDYIYCTVINKEQNEELLANVPHQDLLDLALIAKIVVLENICLVIDNMLCNQINISAEAVIKIARENTFAEGYRCRKMSDVIKEMVIKDGVPPEFISDICKVNNNENSFYILTNKYSLNGATMLASNSILENIYNDIGDNYFILPISLQKVILVLEKNVHNINQYKEKIMEITSTIVSRKDMISENIYHYDGYKKILTIA